MIADNLEARAIVRSRIAGAARPSGGWLMLVTGMLAMIAMSIISVAQAASTPESFAPLVKRLKPAVVNIQVTQEPGNKKQEGQRIIPQVPPGSPFEEFFKEFDKRRRQNPHSRPSVSVGSGFVIDASGLIVTNNHVIDGADKISVSFVDGSRLDAELVGTDPKIDIALLRVKPEKGKPLTAVPWGDSDTGEEGDWVIAIGNPLGLGGTVTAGIISARNRDIRQGSYDDFIQTDASINKGNSGGPLFNVKGEVIGINTAIFSQSGGSIGIGFAVPANMAKPVVAQLLEYGRTKRGWLGVRIQTVSEDMAEALGLDKARGAMVAGVTEGGPAEAAGLQAGDVIVSFNNRDIAEMRELPRIVAETGVGKAVNVRVWRNGKEETFKVKLGELEKFENTVAKNGGKPKKPSKPAIHTVGAIGLKLSGLNDAVRERFKIDESVEDGVVVLDIAEGSSAAEQNIRPGDLILQVNQKSVETPEAVSDLVDNAVEQGRKAIVLQIRRNGNNLFVALKLKAKE